MSPDPESQLAYLNFRLVSPGPLLRPYIRSFWQIRPQAPLETYREEFMHPTGGYGMAFNLGDPLQLDGQPVKEPVFLDGANTVSRKMGFSNRVDVIGIRFHEGGAYPFLGIPLNELQNEPTLLDTLKKPKLLELQSRLAEAPSLSERIRLLEAWLIGRLAIGLERNPLVPASLTMLRQKGWSLPIPELAEGLAVGQRQLERLYRSQVGMSPKQYARLLRVESARLALAGDEANTTTTVGANLGYYDQSHFIREFSAVIGMTPYAYWKRKQKE